MGMRVKISAHPYLTPDPFSRSQQMNQKTEERPSSEDDPQQFFLAGKNCGPSSGHGLSSVSCNVKNNVYAQKKSIQNSLIDYLRTFGNLLIERRQRVQIFTMRGDPLISIRRR
jgi:hypothetical protein